MSVLVDRITAVIEEHLVCDCGDWAEDMHENCAHVAEQIAELLVDLAGTGQLLASIAAINSETPEGK